MRLLSALISGLLFGAGLVLSGMINPQKVTGFLDVAGRWDPSLAFVMMGAIPVAFVAFRIAAGRSHSVLGEPLCLPTTRLIDARLVLGSALFGIGWGMAGYCPGPVVVSLSLGGKEPVLFVASMLVGMAVFEAHDKIVRKRHNA